MSAGITWAAARVLVMAGGRAWRGTDARRVLWHPKSGVFRILVPATLGTPEIRRTVTSVSATGDDAPFILSKADMQANDWNAEAGNFFDATGCSRAVADSPPATAPVVIRVVPVLLGAPTGGGCWNDPAPATVRVSVAIAVAGGPQGVGALTLTFQSRTVALGPGHGGFEGSVIISDVTLTLGSPVAFTVHYAADGRGGEPGEWTGTASLDCAPVCDLTTTTTTTDSTTTTTEDTTTTTEDTTTTTDTTPPPEDTTTTTPAP